MTSKKLSRNFYTQPTLKVAKDLLGKYLVRNINGRKIIGKIVETEAYIGPKDRASHAFNWKITERNWVEYLEGGYIYIYLCYGMHWQFNITSSKLGKPECVLIRALEPVSWTRDKRIASGPGKLCKWLKLDKSFNGEDMTKSKRIWLVDAPRKNGRIISAKRIGIDYAKEWAKKPWRFYLKDNSFVSVI